MYLWRKVLLFSFNLLRQRHDISVLLFIVRSHALWRGRMSEFGPIRNHYHVHLVDHSARAGCSTFCCATPCWREPTSSKQLSTVAAFCWFSVWSLSCRCRVKFSTQSSLAEIWVKNFLPNKYETVKLVPRVSPLLVSSRGETLGTRLRDRALRKVRSITKWSSFIL